MIEHNHASPSNCDEAILTFSGCRLAGLIKERLPKHCPDTEGYKTLIFECGWGLTFASNGSYWVVRPENVADAQEQITAELNAAIMELEREKRMMNR